MADRLVVWVYGTRLATLSRASNLRIAMSWEEAGIARWGRGSRILSTSLPLGEPISARDDAPTNFFEDLLPEGRARDVMARFAGVSPHDTFAILAEWGRECAGAVSLTREGETPPGDDDGSYVGYAANELDHALRRLDRTPLGADATVGFKPSLAGFQRKLLVGRGASGQWQRPIGGAPSTWILKPDGRVPIAENEVACLCLARRVGLSTPLCELIHIGGTPTVAIERYDRHGRKRIHQEDASQATGSPAGFKYEQQGGPSLRSFARILINYGLANDPIDLLRRATFNVVIGNADAHGKNFSVLHPAEDAAITLAPVYDVIATTSLRPVDRHGSPVPNDPTMGQSINGVSDVTQVGRDDLVNEAASWGLRPRRAAEVVDDLIERMRSDTDAPDWLAAVVARRASTLSGRTAPRAVAHGNRRPPIASRSGSPSACGAETTKGVPCRRRGACPYHTP
ncbi:MAG: HipA domain-containing protein [Actinomycetota bacterium]|nr:HipA domain-containing protein [Actinomycetota bacterium]